MIAVVQGHVDSTLARAPALAPDPAPDPALDPVGSGGATGVAEREPRGSGTARSGPDLVARARAGERTALAALWDANRRWVAVVLLAHKPASVELEDLLQDVAVTLVTRLRDLRDDEGFRGWLRSVAVNSARAAARSAAVRKTARLDLVDESSARHGGTPEHVGSSRWRLDDSGVGAAASGDRRAARDEGARLLGLATGLAEEYREPLLLKSLHGMSYRQIGVLLDLPETTVETRITRARRMLRELGAARSPVNGPEAAASRAAVGTPGGNEP